MINECTEIEESQKCKSSTGLASSPASPPGPQGRSSAVTQGSKQMEAEHVGKALGPRGYTGRAHAETV